MLRYWEFPRRYEYGNIGKQVYDALKDGAYHQFKAYVAKKAVIATGDVYKIKLIHENRFDHDYALNNLLDDLEPHMEWPVLPHSDLSDKLG